MPSITHLMKPRMIRPCWRHGFAPRGAAEAQARCIRRFQRFFPRCSGRHDGGLWRSDVPVRAALERLKRVGILSGTGGKYLFANGPDRLL